MPQAPLTADLEQLLKDLVKGYTYEPPPTPSWPFMSNVSSTSSNEQEINPLGIGKPKLQGVSDQGSRDSILSLFGTNLKIGPRDRKFEEYKKKAKEFDAMSGLGTVFASGLKLNKSLKKFRSGQSSLFI
jgi:hypothetical protein